MQCNHFGHLKMFFLSNEHQDLLPIYFSYFIWYKKRNWLNKAETNPTLKDWWRLTPRPPLNVFHKVCLEVTFGASHPTSSFPLLLPLKQFESYQNDLIPSLHWSFMMFILTEAFKPNGCTIPPRYSTCLVHHFQITYLNWKPVVCQCSLRDY